MPTDTPEPTLTLTPSATPTATPNYYVEVVTPSGEPARVSREVSIADYAVIVLLFAILISIWLMWIHAQLRRAEERK